jgi:hypothetical protein
MKAIAVGFYQMGYGKGFDKTSRIYNIEGKFYAKSKKSASVAGDGDRLNENLVCVNKFENTFIQVWLSEHKKY